MKPQYVVVSIGAAVKQGRRVVEGYEGILAIKAIGPRLEHRHAAGAEQRDPVAPIPGIDPAGKVLAGGGPLDPPPGPQRNWPVRIESRLLDAPHQLDGRADSPFEGCRDLIVSANQVRHEPWHHNRHEPGVVLMGTR